MHRGKIDLALRELIRDLEFSTVRLYPLNAKRADSAFNSEAAICSLFCRQLRNVLSCAGQRLLRPTGLPVILLLISIRNRPTLFQYKMSLKGEFDSNTR